MHNRQLHKTNRDLKEIMKLIEDIKVDGIKIQDRFKWMAKGIDVLNYFQCNVRERKKVVEIIDLKKKDDNTAIITKDFRVYTCYEFYKHLCIVGSKLIGVEMLREKTFNSILLNFNHKINLRLDAPFTTQELHNVAKVMARSKTLRLDGIVVEFYM